MNDAAPKRPRFISLLLEDIGDDVKSRGLFALVPAWEIAFVGAGVIAAMFMAGEFWDPKQWGVATTVYGTLLTVNGLMLALSWSAFGRIQSSICEPEFSLWLRERDLLNGYFLLIDWIHYAQVTALVVATVGLLSLFYDRLLPITDRVLFGATLGCSAYALRQGLSAVTLMHDVVWAHSLFEGERVLRGGNVTQMRGPR